jgi:hypothetical protein
MESEQETAIHDRMQFFTDANNRHFAWLEANGYLYSYNFVCKYCYQYNYRHKTEKQSICSLCGRTIGLTY